MGPVMALLYGLVCYAVFSGTFLYAIWFVWTLDQPRPGTPLARALLINTGLLLLFALQHSGMARQGFKQVWTKIVPPPIERSTYVLAASLALLLLVVMWQPIPSVIWEVQATAGRMILHGLFWAGWLLVFASTFLLGHFDLFGVKQVWTYWRGQPYKPPAFEVPGPYKLVRHPLYLGFIVAFWSAPRMTLGHLYFAAVTTAWILVAIQLEERDLVTIHGEQYKVYRSGVSMLVPWPGKKSKS
ncbi:MAG: isoprenylcysteine carboxylmethyltransferase family protein [Acidobacteria bacterium]|nr:isoprenylcysteine carboxylmethyltransferase family protein [Acidobacteriota bacterium]